VWKVYDGDTVKVIINYQGVKFNVSIRLLDIDTPEIARCSEEEKAAGLCVRDHVRDLIMGKTVRLLCTGWDKYGGRITAYIALPGGEDLSTHLLNMRYAKPYSGKTTKSPWTSEELNLIIASKQ